MFYKYEKKKEKKNRELDDVSSLNGFVRKALQSDHMQLQVLSSFSGSVQLLHSVLN